MSYGVWSEQAKFEHKFFITGTALDVFILFHEPLKHKGVSDYLLHLDLARFRLHTGGSNVLKH